MLPLDTPVEITGGAAMGRVGFIHKRERGRGGNVSYCVRLAKPTSHMRELGMTTWWTDGNRVRVIGRRAKDPNIAFQMRKRDKNNGTTGKKRA